MTSLRITKMQTILKTMPDWIQNFTLDSITHKIKNCNSVSRMAPLTLITASSRCRMGIIHYKRCCGIFFLTLTMSWPSSATYLPLCKLRSLWMKLAYPALVVLRWRLDKASRLKRFRSDTTIHVPTYSLFARNRTAFRPFRTVCALIHRPWFSVILEAVATPVLVLFAIWDRIIILPQALSYGYYVLGSLFMSVTFTVTFTFRFNLRIVEGCLFNIAAT